MSEKNNKLKNSAKALIATTVLATTVAPYTAQASETATLDTAAKINTAITALDPTKGDDYITAVEAIETALAGLSPLEKARVTTAMNTKFNYHKLAKAVIVEIKDIVDNDVSTSEDLETLNSAKALIATAKANYLKLGSTSRSYVKNYTALTTLETAITKQITYVQNLEKLAAFNNAMEKVKTLPTIDLANVKTAEAYEALAESDKYDTDALSHIAAARVEYNKLTSTLKNLVPDKLAILTKHETQATYQNNLIKLVNTAKVTEFTNQVTNLNTKADDYAAQVAALRQQLDADPLFETQVSAATKTRLSYHEQAALVVEAIKTVTTLELIATADQDELDTLKVNVAAVRTSYSKLGSTSRSFVANVADLIALEAAITARQNYLNNEDALSAWTTAFTALTGLGEPKALDNVKPADYLAENGYGEAQITAITNARAEYDKLSATLKKLVPAADVQLLVNHEAQLKLQEALEAAKDELDANQAEIDKEKTLWTDAFSALNALPTVTFTATTSLGEFKAEGVTKYEDAHKNTITEARTVYDGLSEEAKAQLAITSEHYNVLVAHENAKTQQERLEKLLAAEQQTANQTAADDFKTAVEGVPTTDAATYVNAVGALNYDGLIDAVKALVPAATKLAYDNHKAAAPVVSKIPGLTATTDSIEAIDASTSDAQTTLDGVMSTLTAAKTSYDALSSAAQANVVNAATLTALLAAAKTKQDEITLAGKLAPFKAEMDKLKDSDDGSSLEDTVWTVGLTVADVTIYDDTHTAAIEAAEEAYGILTQAEKAAVATEYAVLLEHKGYLAKQEELLAEITAYAAVKDAVEAFDDAVVALGNPLDFTGVTTLVVAEGATAVPVYEDGAKTAIADLYTSYTALGEAQKYVTASKETLDQHQAALDIQKGLEAADQSTKLNALKTKIEGWAVASGSNFEEFSTDVAEANTSFGDLTAEEKAVIGTANEKKLANYVAAFAVIDLIEGLKSDDNQAYISATASTELEDFLTTANDIKVQYSSATSAVQTIIKAANYEALTEYITAVTNKQKELLIAETLTAWNAAYDVIKDYTEHTLPEDGTFDYAVYEADSTIYFSGEQLDAIAAAQDEYDELEKMADQSFVNAVDETHKEKLVALQAIVTKFGELKDAQVAAEEAEAAATKDFLEKWDLIKYTPLVEYEDTDTVDNFETKGNYENADELKGTIEEAVALYEAIDATYQPAVADEYAALTALQQSVNQYLAFVTEKENAQLIATELEPWTNLLTDLNAITVKGYVTTITKENIDGDGFTDHTPEARDTVTAAVEAYEALGEVAGIDVKTKVAAEDKAHLDALVAEIKAYDDAKTAKELADKDTAINAVTEAINALDATSTEFLTALTAVELLVMDLSEVAKAEYNANNVAEKTKLANFQAVAPVLRAFNQLPLEDDVNAVTTLDALGTIETSVQAVRASYNFLTEAQKALYPETALKALETAIATKKSALNNALAIKDWTDKYALLPALKDFTDITAETLSTVTLYTAGDIANVEALTETYAGYSADEKALINEDEVAAYEKVAAAVEMQKALQAEAAVLADLTAWKDAFNGLPETVLSFADVTVDTFEAATKYDEAQISAITAARTELGKLTAEVAKYVKAADKSVLEAHEAALAEQTRLQTLVEQKEEADEIAAKVADFAAGLVALNPSAETYVTAYAALQEKYAALEADGLLAKVTAAQKASYNYHGQAVKVVDAITKAIDPTKLEAATTVEAIEALEAELKATQTAYSALGSTSRSYVKNYASVATALTAAAQKKAGIQQAAALKPWADQYVLLPELLDFSGETYETIDSAVKYAASEIAEVTKLRGIYDGFTATVKGYVAKAEYDQLVALEAAIARQQLLTEQATTAAEHTEKLAAWEAAYDALPAYVSVDDLTVDNFEVISTYDAVDVTALIATARSEYSKLEAATKAFVTPAELENINNLEAAYNKYKSIKAQVNQAEAAEAVAELSETIGSVNIENAAELMAAYADLSDEAKALIPNAQVVKLRYYSDAANVIALIEALPATETISTADNENVTTYKTDAQAARTAYSALGSTSRSYVTNLATLTAAEAAITARVKALENEVALATWTTESTDIVNMEVIDFSTITVDGFTEATTYSDDDKVEITQARAEYNALPSTLKSYVASTIEYKTLVALEAAVKAQASLEAQVATAAATEFAARITALTGNEEAFVVDVATLNTELEALDAAVQSKISAAATTRLTYLTQAAAVVEEINGLEAKLEGEVAVYKTAVTTARSNYAKLGSTSRSFVKNISLLAEHEVIAKSL